MPQDCAGSCQGRTLPSTGVRYEAAGTLVTLSSAPTELIFRESDNKIIQKYAEDLVIDLHDKVDFYNPLAIPSLDLYAHLCVRVRLDEKHRNDNISVHTEDASSYITNDVLLLVERKEWM